MLINQIGVETDDDIVELDVRRTPRDPKNRETMTMLLHSALSALTRSEPPTPARRSDVSPLAATTIAPGTHVNAHPDAA